MKFPTDILFLSDYTDLESKRDSPDLTCPPLYLSALTFFVILFLNCLASSEKTS